MISRLFTYATLIVALALSTTTLWAQESGWPIMQRAQTTWSVEPLPVAQNFSSGNTTELPSRQLPNATANPSINAPQSETAPTDPITPSINDETIDESKIVELTPSQSPTYTSGMRDFWGYRYEMSSLDWIIGNQFGMFTMNSDHYQRAGVASGISAGIDISWVNGPTMTEMPPRLYDFSIAYQSRKDFGFFAYDVAASVMASSDFEGSAREGIRYPSHAVGFLYVNPVTQLVFGVDYLDRGDIKLLPVAGLIWIPRDDIRLELVFPRPRATFELSSTVDCECDDPEGECVQAAIQNYSAKRLYIAGELGGGTWAVERGGMYDDLATYRDLRLNIGLESVESNGSRSALEVSWLFARRLEFTSGRGNTNLDDTAMLRWIHSY